MAREIVLSGAVVNHLLGFAISCNAINVQEPELLLYLMAESRGHPRVLQRQSPLDLALSSLILYGKAFFDDRDWGGVVDLGPLMSEDLLTPFPYDIAGEYLDHLKEGDLESPAVLALDYLRPFLLPMIYKMLKGKGIFSTCQWVSSFENSPFDFNYYQRRKYVDFYIDFISHGMTLKSLIHSPRWMRDRCSIASLLAFATFSDWMAGRHGPLTVDAGELGEYDIGNYAVTDIIHSVVGTCAHFDFAARNMLPLVSDLRATAAPRGIRETIDELSKRDRAYNLFKLTLPQMGLRFHSIKNIDDLLRLREDHRITRFRHKMEKFSLALAGNDTSDLSAIHTEVSSALRCLGGLDKWIRISNLVTYLSIPTAVVEAWLSIPIIGPSLALLGTFGQAVADIKSLKHKWVLFGT